MSKTEYIYRIAERPVGSDEDWRQARRGYGSGMRVYRTPAIARSALSDMAQSGNWEHKIQRSAVVWEDV